MDTLCPQQIAELILMEKNILGREIAQDWKETIKKKFFCFYLLMNCKNITNWTGIPYANFFLY